jgi:general secretion pathway protein J
MRQDGYTLLEVIIALTLLSILAVMLSGSLSFGERVWERTSGATRSSGDLASTFQFLDATLSHVRLERPQSAASGGNSVPSFIGKPESVEFFANDMAAVGLAGVRRVRVAWRGTSVIVSVDNGGTEDAQANDAVNTSTLMADVSAFRLEYRGYDDGHHDTGWQTDWSFLKAVPRLVRVNISRPIGRTAEWTFRLPEPSH